VSSGPSGVDLARQALAAARAAAKNSGSARKGKPRRPRGAVVRRDGREPLGLGAAITMMMTERGMAAPAAGGSVLAQWEDIAAAVAPELAGRTRAVAFNAETGRLDIAPSSPAIGTTLRWNAQQLVARANEQVAGAAVRTLHVLPPGPRTGPSPTAAGGPAPAPNAAPAGPVRTRENASAGYRRALAAHRQAVPPRRAAPDITAVLQRQAQAMRELSARAFPHEAALPPVPSGARPAGRAAAPGGPSLPSSTTHRPGPGRASTTKG
jgi:Dna[CI] antecedent, DciA